MEKLVVRSGGFFSAGGQPIDGGQRQLVGQRI
jgi:hypothetical protein